MVRGPYADKHSAYQAIGLLTRNRDPEAYGEIDDGSDERTAVVSLADLRAARRIELKDRHLFVRVRGAQLGQVTRLPTTNVRVGRAQDCELWLADDGVSRRHARIFPEDLHYVIEDTQSANGTFISGQRVEHQILRDGDMVQFGPQAVFRYSITDESQEALLRQLYEASVTDALTGAANREHFDSQLRAELSYARRHKTDLSLVLFDVDHFKKVNDTYQHPVGDQVLVQIAAIVRREVRNEDVFARYGGEEFALVLRGIDIAGARTVGDRLRLKVSQNRIPLDQGELVVTVSAGCASLTTLVDQTPEAMILASDQRLYAAKRGGRNRVVAADEP
jgi:two-component system, cell cycle response regulator